MAGGLDALVERLKVAVSASTDSELDTKAAMLAWINTLGTLLFLIFKSAPYGKFVDTMPSIKFWMLPAKLAWVAQELPAFGIPAYWLLSRHHTVSLTQLLLILPFLLHYFNRYLF